MTAIDANTHDPTCTITIPIHEPNTDDLPDSSTITIPIHELNTDDLPDSSTITIPIHEPNIDDLPDSNSQQSTVDSSEVDHARTTLMDFFMKKMHESLIRQQQQALRNGLGDLQRIEEQAEIGININRPISDCSNFLGVLVFIIILVFIILSLYVTTLF